VGEAVQRVPSIRIPPREPCLPPPEEAALLGGGFWAGQWQPSLEGGSLPASPALGHGPCQATAHAATCEHAGDSSRRHPQRQGLHDSCRSQCRHEQRGSGKEEALRKLQWEAEEVWLHPAPLKCLLRLKAVLLSLCAP